ncbi:MAG: PVC-type heme-binding CxxCH protein [Planctomycetota bacterium]
MRAMVHVSFLLFTGILCLFVSSIRSANGEDKFAAFNANPLLVAPTEAITAQEQQAKFRLPPGFEIELVAAEPEIQKPMNLSFDAAGRLYITHSLEYPYPPTSGKPRDALSVFVDSDGDGKYDRKSTYADGLNIPIGVTPIHDGVLCYSIPAIHRLRDLDGDGKVDERKVAYSTFGTNDTHGMASSFNWWIDGWVYGCHGFANRSKVKGADGREVEFFSGNTYRLKPDGSHIEQYTHGQVNPFGMCFDPLGNIFTSDCHTKPAYMILRGAWYPMFGDVHDGLGMGPELMQHLHGSTGIAGIVHYSADQFPEAYRGTLFIGNPVTGRINHDQLEQHGSSYRAVENPDFLSCEDPWFRPVDLKIGPDGCLYVADFYNCIIGHYEVPLEHPRRDRHRGRVWKISYVGEEKNPQKKAQGMPDLTKDSADQLIERLGDANIVLRVQATHQLVHRIGKPAIEPLTALFRGKSTPRQRTHGMWALERLGGLKDEELADLLQDEDREVRVHAVKLLAERPTWNDAQDSTVVAALADTDPFVRRAAADALGKHPSTRHIEPLMDAWSKAPADDTHLIHVARMSLRDNLQSEPDMVATGRRFSNDAGRLALLAEVSLGIRNANAANFLFDCLRHQSFSDGNKRDRWIHHVARYSDAASLPAFFKWLQTFQSSDPETQRQVLLAAKRAMQERGEAMSEPVIEWGERLARGMLGSESSETAKTGLEFSRELSLAALFDDLERASSGTARHAGNRGLAIEVLRVVDANRAVRPLAQLLADQQENVAIRKQAAEVLGSIDHSDGRSSLVAQLLVAPSDLAVSIARGLSRTDQGAEALLGVIASGKGSPLLLRDDVVLRELRFRTVKDKESRLAELQKDLPSPSEELAKLMNARRATYLAASPDKARGAEIFEKTCSKCHQIGGKGERIGPQLDGIGVRGLDRLLEDTLNPNQNVDQAFRSTVLALSDGQVVTGLVLREEGALLVLANAEGKPVRVPLADIEERRISALSPMPTDVASKLEERDLHDLLAFLLEQKVPAAPTAAP